MKYNFNKIITSFIVLLGAIITIYGVILCVMSNLNLGVFLVILCGIFVLCTGLFYKKLKKFTNINFFRTINIIFIIFFCAELSLISIIAFYGRVDTVNYKEDAIIVLGAGIRGEQVTLPLKLRLDKAIEYHSNNPDALIVVTGGKGFQETVTEAFAMERYLIENGIDKSKIIKEEKAASTEENMKYSKEILDSLFDDEYSVVIITNNFHVYRGINYAKRTGFQNVTHLHAGLQWYNLMPCYLRESLAVVKMLVLG